MRTVSNGYKLELTKLGKEIDFKFDLHTNDKLITEDNKFLITESNLNLLVEQLDEEEVDLTITQEDIYSVNLIRHCELLSTIMQEIDFEVVQDLRVGDSIDAHFGLKINGQYEYVDYGRFIIYSKEFNEDTKTYSYVAFDGMLLSMIEMDDRTIVENVSVKTAIENICNKVGLTINITQEDIENYPNLNNVIPTDTFKDLEITYRDVLNNISQCLGINIIAEKRELHFKSINRLPVATITANYLKDVNVKFGKKYGPINSVVLSRSEDNDNIYRKSDTSIELYGLTEFKIRDNPIMLGNNREDYIDEIFDQLNGLEYYMNDFNSTGITFLDPLDMYMVMIDNNIYNCLMLNDEIKVVQGLEESVYTEEPEETTTNYKTSSKTDKEVSFIVDKQKGSINAKVSKGDVINEINLDESGAIINAEKISLEGKEINLTGDDINIKSTNFELDKYGNCTANSFTSNNAQITGGKIDIQGTTGLSSIDIGDTSSNYSRMYPAFLFHDNYDTSVGEVYSDFGALISPRAASWDAFGWYARQVNGYQQIQLVMQPDGVSKLFVKGSNGTGYALYSDSGLVHHSDRRLKDNIEEIDLEKSKNIINGLKPVRYTMKNGQKLYRGFIAQNVKEVLEQNGEKNQIYTIDEDGYYMLTYEEFIADIVGCNKYLIKQIEELKKEINSLKGGK